MIEELSLFNYFLVVADGQRGNVARAGKLKCARGLWIKDVDIATLGEVLFLDDAGEISARNDFKSPRGFNGAQQLHISALLDLHECVVGTVNFGLRSDRRCCCDGANCQSRFFCNRNGRRRLRGGRGD